MAITAATLRSDFSGFLPAPLAGPIFERTARLSVVQQLARQVPLGAEGVSIPVVSGSIDAGWVAEGATKPADGSAMTLKTITPKKLAVIVVTSAEVVRANPGTYITTVRGQIAEAFARAFDRAALHDEGPTGTGGGGPFSTYIDQTTKSAELGATSQANGGVFVDLVEAMDEIVGTTDGAGRDRELTGWALDSRMEVRLLRSVDTTGHPIWAALPTDDFSDATLRRGQLLQRPSYMGPGIRDNAGTIVGYGGDWSQAAWGVVGGISYDVSDEAPVTINGSLVSMWENNLVGIRAEAEFGFLVNDTDAFVQLRNDSGS
jgi:HK97 family phage major capsid protein